MIQLFARTFDWIDRALPVLALSFTLLAQSLIASGGAIGLNTPWLIAPDGSFVSYADICNYSGEDAAPKDHCGSCVFFDAPALLESAVTITPIAVPTSVIGLGFLSIALKRPEALYMPPTGPPGS